MIKDEKTRKILIIILIILLLILVVVGLVMMNKDTNKKNSKENTKKESTNNLCVEKICISKVSLEEIESSKTLYIELKNIGNKTIENICVNIVTNGFEFPTCIENAEPEGTFKYAYEYNEQFGQRLKDYTLEKIIEE